MTETTTPDAKGKVCPAGFGMWPPGGLFFIDATAIAIYTVDMTPQEIFASNLRSLREKRRWTQQEVADAMDVSVSWVSQLETGARAAGLPTIHKIAEVFGVSPASLLTPKKSRKSSR